MSATILESVKARVITNLQANRFYHIFGATDDQDAETEFFAWLTTNIATVGGAQLNINDCQVEEVEGTNPLIYSGSAVWKVLDLGSQPTNTFSISFDISGQSEKIDHSIATVASVAATGSPPNHQGAINVNEDGSIDGTDHIVPKSTYNVTYTFPDSTITTSWIHGIASVVGTTNDATFQGFATRELLLTKVSGQKRADGLWDIAFEFAISINKTGITIGDCAGVDKKGWEYLWVQWETNVASSNLCKKAKAVFVEQIYYDSTFTTLGIGSSWSGRL